MTWTTFLMTMTSKICSAVLAITVLVLLAGGSSLWAIDNLGTIQNVDSRTNMADRTQFGQISLLIPDDWNVRKASDSLTFIGPQRKAGASLIINDLQGQATESDSEIALKMAEALALGFGGQPPRLLAPNVMLVEIPAPAIPEPMKQGLQVKDQDLEARMIVSVNDQVIILLGFFGWDQETEEVVRTLQGNTPKAQKAVDQLLAVDFNKGQRTRRLIK